MKELYLTVTEMTFLVEGTVLGHGRTVAAAPGPEQPGEFSAALAEGAVRMGTFRPAQGQAPGGCWQARLEGEEGYSLTFRGDRFLLGQRRPAAAAPAPLLRAGR